MSTVNVTRFDGGMADDIYSGAPGECSISKHFDILSFPTRLSPLRGMAADTTLTGIGNLIVGSNGSFFGMGVDRAGTPTNGCIWKRGASSWTQFAHPSSTAVAYNLLVEYHNVAGTRQLVYATTANTIERVDLADAFAVVTPHALTFTNVAQGVVHPKDDCLYIPYDNKIAKANSDTWTDAALTLPANYRNTGVTPYEDFLAIASCPSVNGTDYGGGGNNSKVFLWDRIAASDISRGQAIDWGAGNLKVLNNLDGVLIGITDQGGSSSNILDRDSIVIRGYAGGEPFIIKEISTIKQTSTIPDATINPRVNFVYRNRLYFSIDISSGSTSPAYHGLFSIGKSKLTGRWSVTMERMATIANTEIAVLAAAIAGDTCVMVYDAEGTLSVSNTTAGTGAQYTATSVYESMVNPEMLSQHPQDFHRKKTLTAFSVQCLPLTATGQIVAKYRVDGATSWTTLFTKTASSPDTNATGYRTTIDASGVQLNKGRYYEFRLESTGGAELLPFNYEYTVDPL